MKASLNHNTTAPGMGVYGAMATTACAVLVLQISLTRLLSATVSAHGAFLVIAAVMLGLASSAVDVFAKRNKEGYSLAASASLAAFRSAVLGLAALVAFTWLGALFPSWGALDPFRIVVGAAAFFWAFHFAGWVVAALLDIHADSVGKLYFADLSGAALGCAAAVFLLSFLPAPSVIAYCLACLALAGVALAQTRQQRRLNGTACALCAALGLAAGLYPAVFPLGSAKGQLEENVLWSRWNNLARVTVAERKAQGLEGADRQTVARWATSWGLSSQYKGFAPASLSLALDSNACTPMLQGGTQADLEVLKWDITSLGQHLQRPKLERTFVIGGGAGRDILSMLVFGAEHVDVAEINPDVVHAVRGPFREWSNDPYGDPRVHLTLAEGRQALESSAGDYDLIQMSMIDTWAASMAGSMVLSEHTLYTIEAFELYISRLSPRGMLSISRWYSRREYGEVSRLVAMLGHALRRAGVERPEEHMAIAHVFGEEETPEVDVATVVVSRRPLGSAHKKTLERLHHEMGFGILWPSISASHDAPFDIASLVSGDRDALEHPVYDLSSATDDRPFFFNIHSLFGSWSTATIVLSGALMLVLSAGFLLVLLPLRRVRRARNIAAAPLPLTVYFAAIGAGFMCVEIALIQRYILFLGHPTYALSVTLLTLLATAGIGSLLARQASSRRKARALAGLAIVVFCMCVAFFVPTVTANLRAWALPARMAVAGTLIAPLGLLMGMMLPMGMARLREIGRPELVPWMWAVNGLAGVIASIGAMFIAIEAGYGAVLICATLSYGAACLADVFSR